MAEVFVVIDGQWHTCAASSKPRPDAWAFPVGDADYPPARWYCATWHSPKGELNRNNYKHTGVDLNLDETPWGDVERTLGLSVSALAFGVVHFVTQNWYGNPMVVIRHEHEGAPLYVRYAHIVPVVKVGETVYAGTKLGPFANWRTGDHLHLDMATAPYTTVWFPAGMMNPVPILELHLGTGPVAEMLAKG